MAAPHILILGGTTDARTLAGMLAGRGDLRVTLSLAGRTSAPLPQPVPVRRGGFGGSDGLATTLALEDVACLVDATHPFAARISANAQAAAQAARCPLVVLRRPPWRVRPGDRWQQVATIADAVAALPTEPTNIFLAIGRQEVAAFAAAPQHAYLVRSIDPVTPRPALPRFTPVLARGPFERAGEALLFDAHEIELVVCKNSGGGAVAPKLDVARQRGLPVVMIERPQAGAQTPAVDSVEEAVAAIDHALESRRGV